MSEPAALFDLTGRVACVTGASAGLGQRAATVLAQAGAQVVGVARRREALEDWASVIGPKAAPVAADLSDRDIIPVLA
ncbi:MAG: SDR family NAD(P)-dependent oxidoreductase, partial [Pseudomonadota bacterium]